MVVVGGSGGSGSESLSPNDNFTCLLFFSPKHLPLPVKGRPVVGGSGGSGSESPSPIQGKFQVFCANFTELMVT